MEFLLRTSGIADGECGLDSNTLEWYYISKGVFDTGKSERLEDIFKIFKSN